MPPNLATLTVILLRHKLYVHNIVLLFYFLLSDQNSIYAFFNVLGKY
jgi:hypothetical protein